MYANDLGSMAFKPEGLKRAIGIIDEWCTYMGMIVRQEKGGVLMCEDAAILRVGHINWLESVQTLTLGGQPFQVCGYDLADQKYVRQERKGRDATYGYFSVPYSHTFSAKKLMCNMMEKAEAKAVRMTHSDAWMRQKIRYIMQNILGSTLYPSDAPLFRLRDLQEIDAFFQKTAKHILHISPKTAGFTVTYKHIDQGLDLPLPSATFMDRAVRYFIKRANSTDDFGTLLRKNMADATKAWSVWSIFCKPLASSRHAFCRLAPQNTSALRLLAYVGYSNLVLELPLRPDVCDCAEGPGLARPDTTQPPFLAADRGEQELAEGYRSWMEWKLTPDRVNQIGSRPRA
jgi:hypothetical protein